MIQGIRDVQLFSAKKVIIKDRCFSWEAAGYETITINKVADWIKYDQHQKGKKSKYWCFLHENLPEKCDNSQPAGAEHFQLWTKQKTLHVPFNLLH